MTGGRPEASLGGPGSPGRAEGPGWEGDPGQPQTGAYRAVPEASTTTHPTYSPPPPPSPPGYGGAGGEPGGRMGTALGALVEYLQQLRPSVGLDRSLRVVGKTKWVARPGCIAYFDHHVGELRTA